MRTIFQSFVINSDYRLILKKLMAYKVRDQNTKDITDLKILPLFLQASFVFYNCIALYNDLFNSVDIFSST